MVTTLNDRAASAEKLLAQAEAEKALRSVVFC